MRSLLVLIARRLVPALAICLAVGCETAPALTHPAVATTAPTTAPGADTASLYDHDWTWQTDAGTTMNLAELRGKPQVVAMFFTCCSGTCGVTVNHLVQIQASLTAEQRKAVGFVLVSFDSKLDTPQALADYRAAHHLPSEWKLMHGSPAATNGLAAALGVPFAPDSARHILHGTQITVVDESGRITKRVVGVNADLHEVTAAIDALTPKQPQPALAAR